MTDTDLIRRSLLNIRKISMTLADEYGNPWIESHMIEREVDAALAALSAPVQEPPGPGVTAGATGAETFQGRVQPWMQACFGPEVSADCLERGDRLLEDGLRVAAIRGLSA